MKNTNYRYKECCQKIISIYHQKGLIKESYNCSSHVRQNLANAASLGERIEELHAKIKEKEALVKLKEKIAKDAHETKKLLMGEIQASVDERMDKLNQIVHSIEKLSRQDMASIPQSADRLVENERQLLEVLLAIIFLKEIPDNKHSAFITRTLSVLMDKDQLVAILRARRDTAFSEATVKRIKAFTQKWSSDKFDKPVFKMIAKFLFGLMKKINLKVLLEARYEKLEEVNRTLIQTELGIEYCKAIDDLKEELEDLLIKQKNSSDDFKAKSRSISDEDARNEQVYKEVTQNLKKAEGKLFKSKVRMKNLFGDCLMLAASISYFGIISQEDKTLLRKNLAEVLSNEKGIEVSEYWHSENENDNAKIFKKLL